MKVEHLVETHLLENGIYYLIRDMGVRNQSHNYEVSAFEDDRSRPYNVYTVTLERGRWYSDSPAAMRAGWTADTDKHVRLVRFWLDKLKGKHGYALRFDGDKISGQQVFASGGPVDIEV